MKFFIEFTGQTEQRLLKYIVDDYSFDTEPSIEEINFDIILNKLNLTVVDNKIVQIWDFCPYSNWIKNNYEIPKSMKGTLKVIDNLESGFFI